MLYDFKISILKIYDILKDIKGYIFLYKFILKDSKDISSFISFNGTLGLFIGITNQRNNQTNVIPGS